MWRLTAIFALALVAACDLTGPEEVCDLVARPAITIEVRDAATGLRIEGSSFLRVRDGAFADSAWGSNGYDLRGAAGRPGTYDIELTTAGHEPWQRSGVAVTSGRCHVRTVHLVANVASTVR